MSTTAEKEAAAADRDRMARLLKGCVLLLLSGVIIFSRTIAVPALTAMLVSIALFPIVNRAAHLGMPRALASLCALLALVGGSSAILYAVREPLTQLAERGPQMLEAGQQLLLRATGRDAVTAVEPAGPAALVVVTPMLARAMTSLAALGMSLVLSYFILTCGTGVGRAMLTAVRDRSDWRNWLRVCGSIRRQAAHYLQLVTAINVVFGVATGVVLTLLHVKDAAAYGVIAGLMNFMPIVGALITTGVIVAGGIAEHGMSSVVLWPALVFLMLHIFESQFVTPQLLGRRLLLNPLIVIAGVLVGAAAWGMGGAFLAVPILTSTKIALDAHPRFRRWGQVLGRGALVSSQSDEARRIQLRRASRRRPLLGKS